MGMPDVIDRLCSITYRPMCAYTTHIIFSIMTGGISLLPVDRSQSGYII